MKKSPVIFPFGNVLQASLALLTCLLLLVSLGAQAKEAFPKITPELYDELNKNLDTTWPHDPAVPDLPPMPVTDNPVMNPNAFLWSHFNDNIFPPRVEGVPERRTRIVTEKRNRGRSTLSRKSSNPGY